MITTLKPYVQLFFYKGAEQIPEKYKVIIDREQISLNLSREKVISFFLIIWCILGSIYVAFEKMQMDPGSPYRGLLISYIVCIVSLSIFIIRTLSKFKVIDENNHKKARKLYLSFVLFLLSWCSIVTTVDQLHQIIVFAFGLAIISASLLMKFEESLFVYIVSFIVLAVGINYADIDYIQKEGFIINSLALIILNIVISNLIYKAFVKDFINRKTILEKTQELEEARRSLEDSVLKRTEELKKASEQLIQEINRRHSMEIQIYKSELENKENAKKLDEALEYDRLRGEFFANISHELRTPLNMIFCTIQMLDLQIKNGLFENDKEKSIKYVKSMRQNCYRLIRLVNNLIDITRIDAGYLRVNPGNNDIISIVEDITLSVKQYVENFGISLIFDTDLEEKVIACDPDKIERVILNLLSNAVKFTKPDGSILVSIRKGEGKVIISVKDTGIGIPEDKHQSVFERFVQVDKSLARQKEGSGIGLSLVKALVEMHLGKIYLKSEPGVGSEFIIELPDIVLDETYTAASNGKIDNKAEIINIEFSDIYTN